MTLAKLVEYLKTIKKTLVALTAAVAVIFAEAATLAAFALAMLAVILSVFAQAGDLGVCVRCGHP